jgi:hypothetical protein
MPVNNLSMLDVSDMLAGVSQGKTPACFAH